MLTGKRGKYDTDNGEKFIAVEAGGKLEIHGHQRRSLCKCMYMVDEASDNEYGEDDDEDKHSEDDNDENDGEDYSDDEYGEDVVDNLEINQHRSWTQLAATVKKGRGPRRIEVRYISYKL